MAYDMWTGWARRNPVSYECRPAEMGAPERIVFMRAGEVIEITTQEFMSLCDQMGKRYTYGIAPQ